MRLTSRRREVMSRPARVRESAGASHEFVPPAQGGLCRLRCGVSGAAGIEWPVPGLERHARELRDRWSEHVNVGQYVFEDAGKYDVTRALPSSVSRNVIEAPVAQLPCADRGVVRPTPRARLRGSSAGPMSRWFRPWKR